MSDLIFPDGFLWGASTSGHQIEGGNQASDWWHWEQSGRAPASGDACDSWNRWREDLQIASDLGLNVFRISVEWARIEPIPGTFDEEAIAHYREVLAAARLQGMKTMLVLWHFTNPQWFAEQGGWRWPQASCLFGRYAGVVADRLGHLVDFWATVNEPSSYVWSGYIKGAWPPGKSGDWLGGVAVYRALADAHRHARRAIIDAAHEPVEVGLTHIMMLTHPAENDGVFSAPAAAWWNFLGNTLFLDDVAADCDWLGVQYYHDAPIKALGFALDDGQWPRTDMGWRIYPQGLYDALTYLWKRYRKPMIVTENGLADALDVQRGRFLLDHLAWVQRAVCKGVDVRGYLHWSLIDNFEWAFGFGPRFGLAEVDYETFERKIRSSGRLYARVIRDNGIAEGLGRDLYYANGMGSLGPDSGSERC